MESASSAARSPSSYGKRLAAAAEAAAASAAAAAATEARDREAAAYSNLGRHLHHLDVRDNDLADIPQGLGVWGLGFGDLGGDSCTRC